MTPIENWARCRHWIEAALGKSDGFETIEDVQKMITTGQYQFWPGKKSAAISEVANFARRKALIVVHAGGDLKEILTDLEPQMCAFAKSVGCNTIMGNGRKGWERASAPAGYRFAWLVMMKELD